MMSLGAILLITLAWVSPSASVCDAASGQSSPSTTRKTLSPDQAGRLLDQISSTLGELTSLRADFVQERRMAAFEDKLAARGTMYFQTPGKIRWELSKPHRSALVLDGKRIAKFRFDDGRRRKVKVGPREIMKEVLKLIARWIQGDFESSRKLFDLRIDQVCTAASPGSMDGKVERTCDFILMFTPRSKRMTDRIRSIELAMDPDSKHVDQVTIRESQGDDITIRFENRECDVELPEDLFALD